MGFISEYGKLRKATLESIHKFARKKGYPNAESLIAQYAKEQPDFDSVKADYSQIPAHRRSQVGLILTVIRCLDAFEPEEPHSKLGSEKAALILNAMLFYVYECICGEYDSVVCYLLPVTNSELYSVLGYLFGRQDKHVARPSLEMPQEIFKMYLELKKFVAALDTVFVSSKIEYFNIEGFLSDLDVKKASLETICIRQNRFSFNFFQEDEHKGDEQVLNLHELVMA